MPKLSDRPLPRTTFESWHKFTPPAGSSYIYGRSVEPRSHLPESWPSGQPGLDLVEIRDQQLNAISVLSNGHQNVFQLRSGTQLERLLTDLNQPAIYLDITGLSHHVWAPLLKAAVDIQRPLHVVYVEPSGYKFSDSPTEGEIFTLSERIRGISPIPGFISLRRSPPTENQCFVPLLGFEGTRLSFAKEQVQPRAGKIFPIIGVPGFRAEYPFHSYLGNRNEVTRSELWPGVRFATANCPFSLFYTLQEIALDYPNDLLKVALIGTKPHALGAVLYALLLPELVELIYDYPISTSNRSIGDGEVHIYHVSAFATGH